MSPGAFGRPPVAVKICGVTDPAAVDAAVDAGADAIGVVLAPGSSRTLTVDRAAELLAAVPPGVARVGVFVAPGVDEARVAVAACGLTHVQVHGVADLAPLDALGVPLVEGIPMRDAGSADLARASRASLVLLDAAVPGQHGGTGRRFDWEMLRATALGRPYALAGGLTPENVGGAIRLLRPAAVDVSSGVESRPGVKDVRLIRRFIAAARAAEAGL